MFKYIDTLTDARDGYIVLPPTGMNSYLFESTQSVIDQGNFSRDPILTELLNSPDLERFAKRKIKTLGSSKYWLHGSPDLSYKDILFNDITSYDRWLGHGNHRRLVRNACGRRCAKLDDRREVLARWLAAYPGLVECSAAVLGFHT